MEARNSNTSNCALPRVQAIPEGFDQGSWNDVIVRIDSALRSIVYHRAMRRAASWALTFDTSLMPLPVLRRDHT
jgi:hypothetical protein